MVSLGEDRVMGYLDAARGRVIEAITKAALATLWRNMPVRDSCRTCGGKRRGEAH